MKAFKPTWGSGWIHRAFNQWFLVVRNHQGIDCIKMFWHTYRLSFKRWLSRHGFNLRAESFLGYRIESLQYSDIKSLFTEMFISNGYFFATESRTPLIIDCGSNIGLSILYFKHLYPDARIIGFEPHTPTFNVLEKNVLRNKLGQVSLNNVAVSDKKGTATLYVPSEKGSSVMTINPVSAKHTQMNSTNSVRTVQLSAFVNEPVECLKLDIEGAEGAVMRDLDKHDRLKFVKRIIMEYHQDRDPKNDLADIMMILKNNGFQYDIQTTRYPPASYYASKAQYTFYIYAEKKIN